MHIRKLLRQRDQNFATGWTSGGEGNGTPLQYSCLDNPMDRGAWKAAAMWSLRVGDTTEQLHFHFSLSCIGEGNGNPLQCCCLENPRDGGAWWAAVYGVTQSRTWLKWLSSSSRTSGSPRNQLSCILGLHDQLPIHWLFKCRHSSECLDLTGLYLNNTLGKVEQ